MTHSFALLSLLCLFLFSIKKLSEFAVNIANSFINLYLKKQWEKEKEWDQAYIFKSTYFVDFEIHQLTITYQFYYLNHVNPLNFFFLILFVCA